MGPAVLLVGCPHGYSELVAEGATAIVGEEGTPFDAHPSLIVIGPTVENQTLAAQRLSHRFVGSGLVIVAPNGAITKTRRLLAMTPYVPLGTRVVADDPAQVREVVALGVARWQARQAREDVLREAGRTVVRVQKVERDRLPTPADGPPARARERLYTSVVEGAPEAILSFTPDGTITAWNPGAERLYGFSAEEAVGSEVTRIVPPDRTEEFASILRRVSQGETFSVETVRIHRTGKTLDVSITVAPIRGDSGEITGASAIVRDIGERLAAENALAERTAELDRARRDYADLYENAPDMYVSVDVRTATISRANRTLYERLGYAPGSLDGRPVYDLYDPDSFEAAEAALRELRTQGTVTNVRLRLRRADGSSLPALLNVTAIRDADGAVVGTRSLLRDISDLTELEARKAAMLEAAQDAIITIDSDGVVLEFNPAAEVMFGYDAPEAVGTKLGDLIVPPELRGRHEEGLRRAVDTGRGAILNQRLELSAVRKDGTSFPVELVVVQLQGMHPPLYTGFIRDLTETRAAQRELQESIEELRRSNEDLEQFAYVASHDLQEPLRMVIAYMDLLERRYGNSLDKEARSYVAFAADGARRMRRLVDDLLGYSRLRSGPRQQSECETEAVLRLVLGSLGGQIRESGAEVTYGALPVVLGDESQLQHVFQNLIANAIKYRRDAPLQIRIDATRAGDMWEFVVTDNGMGFEEAHARRIFQMFQRLHGAGDRSGTGIGLAVAKKIVDQHGGRIWARSSPGVGSRFHFTLRAATGSTQGGTAPS